METQSLAPRTSKIIGREEDLAAIKQAIADGDRRVIYLVGDGGIGKTRILEEISGLHATSKDSFAWPGIIDLYHTEFHSPGGLREAVVNGLDPGQQYFKRYREARAVFQAKRDKGLTGETLEELRLEQDRTFQEDYAVFAQQQRLVLCFDTVELVQYESDEVQKICQIEDEGTVIKTWFLDQVSQLPNTVTIFAGRPKEEMQRDFAAGFTDAGCHFELRPLKSFDDAETKAYLTDICRGNPELTRIVERELERLHEISSGRPIYLAILIDLLRHSPTVGTIFDAFDDEQPGQENKKTANRRLEVGAKLIELFTKLPAPLNQMLYWLIRARKGLDTDLLRYLEPTWSTAEIQDNLDSLKRLAIVKHRDITNQYFLHDEIYDLVDLFHLNDPLFADGFQPLLDYYRQPGDPVQLSSDEAVARLYYELRLDPRRGYYEYYARWDETAIDQHDIGFDMRMRDEVLHFLNRFTAPPLRDPFVVDRIDRADIDRDCAVRWVKRYFSRGQYRKADQVARDLRYSQHPTFDWDVIDDWLYKARLQEIWAINKIYLGQDEDTIRSLLRNVIQILRSDREWQDHERWWVPLILGRAYTNAGYMHRQRRRYGTTIKYYTAAINQFRQTNAELDMAMTLTNQAYAHALLGNISAAENQIKDAINLHRQRLQLQGREYDYWSTLSLNARGAIQWYAGKPHLTVETCRQSKAQFTELNEDRGVAFANLNLGEAYRVIGNAWYGDETRVGEAQTNYSKSDQALDQAFNFFSEINPSGALIDVYLEQSKLKRNQGLLERHLRNHEMTSQHFEKAVTLLNGAIQQAKEEWRVQKIDCLEDIADLMVLRGQLDEARKKIDETAALVPNEYFLERHAEFQKIAEPVEDFWNVLGRLELHRGRMIIIEIYKLLPNLPATVFPPVKTIDLSREEKIEYLLQAMEHYARAVTYFLAFSPELSAHERTFSEIYDILKDQSATTLQRVRERVVDIDELYDTIDLSPLLHHIDQTLGAMPDIEDLPSL